MADSSLNLLNLPLGMSALTGADGLLAITPQTHAPANSGPALTQQFDSFLSQTQHNDTQSGSQGGSQHGNQAPVNGQPAPPSPTQALQDKPQATGQKTAGTSAHN